jgi:hypothetical protein
MAVLGLMKHASGCKCFHLRRIQSSRRTLHCCNCALQHATTQQLVRHRYQSSNYKLAGHNHKTAIILGLFMRLKYFFKTLN